MAEHILNANQFDGTSSFPNWKSMVIDILESKGVAHIIDRDHRTGDIKAFSPEDQKANGLAKVIIRAALAPTLQYIVDNKTAFEVWQELHKTYSVVNTTAFINQLKRLIELRMLPGESNGIAHTNAFEFLTREMPIKNLSQRQLGTLIYIASLNERFEQVVTKYGSLDPRTYTREQVYDDVKMLTMVMRYATKVQGIPSAK